MTISFCVQVEPGDHIIDQGDDGDNFYVIDRCVYQLSVATHDKHTHSAIALKQNVQ